MTPRRLGRVWFRIVACSGWIRNGPSLGLRRFALSGRSKHPTEGIANTELIVFEDCSHTPIYENVEGFNQQTLDFLERHSG